jgi:hypothetical protein
MYINQFGPSRIRRGEPMSWGDIEKKSLMKE